MSLAPVSGATSTGTASGSSSSALVQGVSEQQFFQLLGAELANQNPTQPVNSTQFIAQLATFAQLSALTHMQSSLSTLASAPILNGAALIGKTVTTASGSGTVTGALVQNQQVMVQVSGLGAVPLSAISSVA